LRRRRLFLHFFLVSCDATTPRWHPLSFSFSFSVLTTRCILHTLTVALYFYISNVSVPVSVPQRSL
jgi:hypothetical protein